MFFYSKANAMFRWYLCKTNVKPKRFRWFLCKTLLKSLLCRGNIWTTLRKPRFAWEPMESIGKAQVFRWNVWRTHMVWSPHQNDNTCPDFDLDENNTKVKPYWSNLSMVWNPHQDTQKCPDLDLDEDGSKVKPYWSNQPMVWNPHQDIQIYHGKPWRRDVTPWSDAVHCSYGKQ